METIIGIILKTLDIDGNGTVELPELEFFFKQAENREEMARRVQTMLSSGNKAFLTRIFKMFDREGRGRLTEQDLHDVCKYLRMRVSRKFVKKLLLKMDEDGNGMRCCVLANPVCTGLLSSFSARLWRLSTVENVSFRISSFPIQNTLIVPSFTS